MFIELNGWEVDMRFSAAHFIPSHDKCSRLHGHDYGIRIRVYGEKEGAFIIDFLELRKHVIDVIGPLDHRVLVPEMDSISTHRVEGDQVVVEYQGKRFSFFKPDVFFVPSESTSSESLAAFIGRNVLEKISESRNITRIELSVDEGPGMGAWVEIPF
jgi:6-pyruvoyltetrahydropterin/6-carboxytetrahydropterin synthase